MRLAASRPSGSPVDDVALDHAEAAPASQVRGVQRVTGREVVDRNDLVATLDQPLAKVAADEAGATGHDHHG